MIALTPRCGTGQCLSCLGLGGGLVRGQLQSYARVSGLGFQPVVPISKNMHRDTAKSWVYDRVVYIKSGVGRGCMYLLLPQSDGLGRRDQSSHIRIKNRANDKGDLSDA